LSRSRSAASAPRLAQGAGQARRDGQREGRAGEGRAAVAPDELRPAVGERGGARPHGLVVEVPAHVVGEGRSALIALGGGLAQGAVGDGLEVAPQPAAQPGRRRAAGGGALVGPGGAWGERGREPRRLGLERRAHDLEGPRRLGGEGVAAAE
jgi:hypothetical protein